MHQIAQYVYNIVELFCFPWYTRFLLCIVEILRWYGCVSLLMTCWWLHATSLTDDHTYFKQSEWKLVLVTHYASHAFLGHGFTRGSYSRLLEYTLYPNISLRSRTLPVMYDLSCAHKHYRWYTIWVALTNITDDVRFELRSRTLPMMYDLSCAHEHNRWCTIWVALTNITGDVRFEFLIWIEYLAWWFYNIIVWTNDIDWLPRYFTRYLSGVEISYMYHWSGLQFSLRHKFNDRFY